MKVEPHVTKAGEDISSQMYDALIEKTFGDDNLGGCRKLDYGNYPEENRDIIKKYIEEEDFQSVDGIYIAMKRAEKSG